MRSDAAVESVKVNLFERIVERFVAYVQLTKPRIILWFGLTGVSAMIVEGSLLRDMSKMWMIFLGTVLCAASANAYNQFIERDLDAQMERTKNRRPLPLGRMSAFEALGFATVVGVLSTWILYTYGNALTAVFGVSTIAFYTLVYTMYLKPRTPYNIVIGGAAGATAPLIGWAAATGSISWIPFLMFALIVVWTPPHFWALALCIKKDYEKNKIPMLPVVAGEEVTRRQMFWYCVALVPFSLIPFFIADLGWIFFGVVLLGSLGFLWKSIVVLKKKTEAAAWSMFKYSLLFLLMFFMAIATDSILFMHSAKADEKIPEQLRRATITEKLGDKVDLNLKFRNEAGELVSLKSVFSKKKPVILLMAYYACPNLCNFFLNGVTDSLKQLQWTPGKEFELLTISIDPRETPELARAKKENHINAYGRKEGAKGWHFWINDKKLGPEAETNASKLAAQVGFGYEYDKETQQYGHSTAMIFLTPNGRVARYLYGIEFKKRDFRLAVTETSGGKIGNVVDRLLLFCYNYDPKTRKYSLYAVNLMRAGGGLTVLALVLGLGSVWVRSRHRGGNT